jgi:low temperature requirement protein LtrA
MGDAFTEEPFELERLLALAIGFMGTVALWWCYFHRAEHIGVELAERPEVAGAAARWGTWTVTLMVLALIAIAVGDELAIAHPGDDATLGFTLLTFGGPACSCSARSSSGTRRSGASRRRDRWDSRRSRSSQSPLRR